MRRLVAAFGGSVCLASALVAQEIDPLDEALEAAAEAVGAARAEPEPRFPPYEEVVTPDMQTVPGLITLHRHDPNDQTKDRERLLASVGHDLLGQDLLFATSITSGGFFTGWMWQDHLIRFEVVDKQLLLTLPETRYAQPDQAPVTDAVRRTYNRRWLAATPILCLGPGGEPVIDLGALLKSDLADVAWMGGFTGAGSSVMPELSRWTKVKDFPDNVLIEVDLALGGERGGGSIGVGYAFRRLPDLGAYTPRKADDRVGYFLTAQQDLTKGSDARDTFERLIHRWALEKRDPSLEVSPPKQPITFVIEKTVPVQWRRWVRQGILDWNKAFEKIGYTDAIVAQQQTDDNEFKDYDPEDARYNFFRWIVSGQPFAMGPSRVDPRTGQILDADIVFDDSMVRFVMGDYDVFGPTAWGAGKAPAKEWLAAALGQRDPALLERLLPQRLRATNPRDRLLREAQRRLPGQRSLRLCTLADGLRRQMAFTGMAIRASLGPSGKPLPERFVGEVVREVVAHEVGHTLGLRHNFKASSWLTLDEVKQRRTQPGQPLCGSVMDYNPVLFFAGDKLESCGAFVTPTLGPYDEWAIAYGYGAPPDGDEDAYLKAVASRSAEPGLAFATDEDTVWVLSPDPSVNRFDQGADPIAWARSRVELADGLISNVQEWAIQEGEGYAPVRRAFEVLLAEKSFQHDTVARLIGGQAFHRDHRGDPGARPPLVPVDAATQRAALALLCDTLWTEGFVKVDPVQQQHLVPHRWWHWESEPDLRLDYPIHDRIAFLHWWTLFDVLAAPLVQRVYDAELKTPAADRFTAAELLTTLRDRIWTQLGGDGRVEIGSVARNLQREWLDTMLLWAQLPPGVVMSTDLQGLYRHCLRELAGRIDQALQREADFATRAHLTEARSRITRALEAQFQAE